MKGSRANQLLKLFLTLLVVLVVFAFWYKWRYSMEPVTGYEINQPDASVQLLIATQGSSYKNAILERVIKGVEQSDLYIKVVDVLALNDLDPNRWDALLILHTWEMGHPPVTIMPFINRLSDLDRLVVHNTAGDGVSQIEGVDAITGASNMAAVPDRSTQIIQRLNAIIDSSKQSISIK